MAWEYRPVEMDRLNREFAEGVERRGAEIAARLAKIEEKWEGSEEARRREWEVLEGRAMTAWEEIKHFNDGLLRKNTMMTEDLLAMIWQAREEGREAHAEFREEMRANREATLKMLGRLSEPPFG